MAVVIDTSVAVGWFVPSQASAYADRIARRTRREALVVPPLWEAEFANVMVVLLRRRVLALHQVAAVLGKAERLDPVVDRDVASARDQAMRQFSILRPPTRPNSRSFEVTSTSPRASAHPAISAS